MARPKKQKPEFQLSDLAKTLIEKMNSFIVKEVTKLDKKLQKKVK